MLFNPQYSHLTTHQNGLGSLLKWQIPRPPSILGDSDSVRAEITGWIFLTNSASSNCCVIFTSVSCLTSLLLKSIIHLFSYLAIFFNGGNSEHTDKRRVHTINPLTASTSLKGHQHSAILHFKFMFKETISFSLNVARFSNCIGINTLCLQDEGG